MSNQVYRIGIVGAASLAGRELNDALQLSELAASELVLLEDDESAAGQMTAAGDEASFIQGIEAGSFERLDFVFFTGDAARTKQHWQQARRAGASIVDMTYALDGQRDVLVRSPLAEVKMAGLARERGRLPDLKTPAVVAAHPAAVMLAMVAAELKAALPVRELVATVMEPASEHGRAAMDELHQQTVNLLSFQSVPQEQYDAQVAFNLQPEVGKAAKVRLAEVGKRVREHYRALSHGALPELTLQMVQAPVFHGYTASVLVELEKAATVEEVAGALAGEPIEVMDVESEVPSNLSATGQRKVLVRVNRDGEESSTRFWLWVAADNLNLAAVNAISCALELSRLRPSGKVQ